MTPAQAREYATRIRLGDRLLFWYSTGTVSFELRGGCFSDFTPVARWDAGRDPGLDTRPVPHPHRHWPMSSVNRGRILVLLDKVAMLDQIANAP
jgi:hypothetical protein